MLFPTVAKISDKGQVLIPAKTRKAIGLEPGDNVYITLKQKERKVEIETIGKDLIKATYGMLANASKGRSMTDELVEERKRDLKREEKKYATSSFR
jgi:AbrB family looped-hinge helix DNA binding protein